MGAAVGYNEPGWLMNLSLGWNHQFLDETAWASASLAGSEFTMHAAPPGRNFLDLTLGFSVFRASGISLGANYLLLASRASTSHGGLANLQFVW